MESLADIFQNPKFAENFKFKSDPELEAFKRKQSDIVLRSSFEREFIHELNEY